MECDAPVCLYYARTGTCRNGDACPLKHADNCDGISTKYDDRVWARSEASSSAPAEGGEPHSQWDIRIMTYNILAEGLAQAHGDLLYQDVPPWCLTWRYRRPGLMAEIKHYRPDVMSLQEVDHMDQLEAELGPLGYEGRYAKRSGTRSDGCATFWLKDKFCAVAVDIVRFQNYNLQDNVALLVLLHRKGTLPEDDEDDLQSGEAVEVTMTVDESGDVSMLSGEVNKWFRLHADLPAEAMMDPALLVANTHILFNPKRGDIKIAQARTLLTVMNDIVHKCNGNALAMVMGDFNSTPESAVYRFIKAGELDCQTVARKLVSGQIQGSTWPAAMEKMARQRSAPTTLTLEDLFPRQGASPRSTEGQAAELQSRDSPGPSGSRLKPMGRGMTHVTSEPQLAGLGEQGEDAESTGGRSPLDRNPLDEAFTPSARSANIQPSRLEALQTLPDAVPNPTRLRLSPSSNHINRLDSRLDRLSSGISIGSEAGSLLSHAPSGAAQLLRSLPGNGGPDTLAKLRSGVSSPTGEADGYPWSPVAGSPPDQAEPRSLQQAGRSASLEARRGTAGCPDLPPVDEQRPTLEGLPSSGRERANSLDAGIARLGSLGTEDGPSRPIVATGQPPTLPPSTAEAGRWREGNKQLLQASGPKRALASLSSLERKAGGGAPGASTVEILAQAQQHAKEADGLHLQTEPKRDAQTGQPPLSPHLPPPASPSSGSAVADSATAPAGTSPRGPRAPSALSVVAENSTADMDPSRALLPPSNPLSPKGGVPPGPGLAHAQRRSGDSARLGPSPGNRPLFRDDSCTWSPEHLQMAVGCLPEELEAWAAQEEAEREAPGDAADTAPAPAAGPEKPSWIARHPLRLRSAFSEVTGSEPAYTTAHSKFLGTVDYMWYTPQADADAGIMLTPVRTLLPPPLKHLYCGLPSPEWQSDHMSLVTDFTVRQRASKRAVMLRSVVKKDNMVRARSKCVDASVFAAALGSLAW